MDKAGFVVASEYRKKLMERLKSSPATPKSLARDTGIHLNHVSTVLGDLAGEGLVYCVNPQRKRGRVYKLTEQGKSVSELVSKV